MSALDGIRIRVEASTGLHDRPLHYQGSIPWYHGQIYNTFLVLLQQSRRSGGDGQHKQREGRADRAPGTFDREGWREKAPYPVADGAADSCNIQYTIAVAVPGKGGPAPEMPGCRGGSCSARRRRDRPGIRADRMQSPIWCMTQADGHRLHGASMCIISALIPFTSRDGRYATDTAVRRHFHIAIKNSFLRPFHDNGSNIDR